MTVMCHGSNTSVQSNDNIKDLLLDQKKKNQEYFDLI